MDARPGHVGRAVRVRRVRAGYGLVAKAVSGYTFDDAAKESPDTKNFHSADGS